MVEGFVVVVSRILCFLMLAWVIQAPSPSSSEEESSVRSARD